MTLYNFNVRKTERIVPDSQKEGDIFSRLPYTFEDAIADLIDNAIDEKASWVHIRFVLKQGTVHSVIIADNGFGMDDIELKEAMRFGSRNDKTISDLGKYGIGLKSASLSQANTVIVLSHKEKNFCGRRWTLENVKDNWTCELLCEDQLEDIFNLDFGENIIINSGTIIIWQRLDHLQVIPSTLEKILQKKIADLKREIGLRFHRFIENGRLKVSIDKHEFDELPVKLPINILPLNPFSYNQSGAFGYPLQFKININGIEINICCHIWPPNSKSIGYKLGGGNVASRQGFYFYRNDRIIQAGGWNGLIADNSEPHLSLARVMIDLPPELDSHFKLDVTKSNLYPSPAFLNLLNNCTANGIKFNQYLDKARESYRKNTERKPAFPYIPGNGFPQKTLKEINRLLHEDINIHPQEINFKWDALNNTKIFQIDNINKLIILNSKYKKRLEEGHSGDAPILKLLILFLCQDKLDMTNKSEKASLWLQKINISLLAGMGEK